MSSYVGKGLRMPRFVKKIIILLPGFIAVLLLSGCAGTGGVSGVDRETLLEQRLESYIEAREHNDAGQLMTLYLKPERARIGNVVVSECGVLTITIAADKLSAETKLTNKIQVMGFTFDKLPTTLNWVWSKGNWFIIVKESDVHPFTGKKRSLKRDGKSR